MLLFYKTLVFLLLLENANSKVISKPRNKLAKNNPPPTSPPASSNVLNESIIAWLEKRFNSNVSDAFLNETSNAKINKTSDVSSRPKNKLAKNDPQPTSPPASSNVLNGSMIAWLEKRFNSNVSDALLNQTSNAKINKTSNAKIIKTSDILSNVSSRPRNRIFPLFSKFGSILSKFHPKAIISPPASTTATPPASPPATPPASSNVLNESMIAWLEKKFNLNVSDAFLNETSNSITNKTSDVLSNESSDSSINVSSNKKLPWFPLQWLTSLLKQKQGTRVSNSSHLPSNSTSLVLIELMPNASIADIKTCKEKNIKSCIVATVHSSALESARFSIPHCKDMVMKDVIDPSFKSDDKKLSSTSLAYSNNEGCEAMFSFSEGALMGNIEKDGQDFYIEPCRAFKGCYVWKEQNTAVFKDLDQPKYLLTIHPRFALDIKVELKTRGETDFKTLVPYSVKFYYTKEFKAIMMTVEKIRQYFSLIVSETNQGYKSSGIKVRMQIHCFELLTNIRETSNPQQMLETFKGTQKYNADLRGSADVAVLIVSNLGNACGMGYVDSWRTADTLSVVDYQCARGYYSLGHEVGHNFGCVHDRDHEFAQPSYKFAFGSYIGKGPYRTIMSYNGPNHDQRADIYSSPVIKYQGVVTGGTYSDCARVIMRNRFLIAATGDEKIKCRYNV